MIYSALPRKYQIFPGASPPVPLLFPSFLHPIDHEILVTTAQIPIFFLGAKPPDPLIYPSGLHSIDQEIQISNSLWGFSPRPLISPSFLHPIDQEILVTTAQISKIFLGWRLHSQTLLSILPVYIQ